MKLMYSSGEKLPALFFKESLTFAFTCFLSALLLSFEAFVPDGQQQFLPDDPDDPDDPNKLVLVLEDPEEEPELLEEPPNNASRIPSNIPAKKLFKLPEPPEDDEVSPRNDSSKPLKAFHKLLRIPEPSPRELKRLSSSFSPHLRRLAKILPPLDDDEEDDDDPSESNKSSIALPTAWKRLLKRLPPDDDDDDDDVPFVSNNLSKIPLAKSARSSKRLSPLEEPLPEELEELEEPKRSSNSSNKSSRKLPVDVDSEVDFVVVADELFFFPKRSPIRSSKKLSVEVESEEAEVVVVVLLLLLPPNNSSRNDSEVPVDLVLVLVFVDEAPLSPSKSSRNEPEVPVDLVLVFVVEAFSLLLKAVDEAESSPPNNSSKKESAVVVETMESPATSDSIAVANDPEIAAIAMFVVNLISTFFVFSLSQCTN
ncbi:uncharacterized protein PRCAT00001018001 [Priceomyces carsonii]|uniref:uncharacterized protein n=1 Tax=Priceomyces carsonii TaxID=28549 RepID=UPI002ED938A2|nr:unnamed protein product [Priceomyces carsonii]